MPRLEDFQAGVPLSDELARIKAGFDGEPAKESSQSQTWEFGDLERPLTESEREDLARLLAEPGWRVLERLRKRALRTMERNAMLVSEIDPLGNKEKIVNGWAYLMAFRQAVEMDARAISAETAQLKREK